MNDLTMKPTGTGKRRFLKPLMIGLISAVVGAGLMRFLGPSMKLTAEKGAAESDHEAASEESDDRQVIFPKEKWGVAKIQTAPVQRGPFQRRKWVTGKLTMNMDRTAHIFSLTEGRVHEVPVRFGQDLEAGEVLAVIDSKEVGQAKLDLAQSRLATQFAQVNNDWNQQISENTSALIEALKQKMPINEIEERFRNEPMGDYRGRLLTAYANLHKSRADFERLDELAKKGITAGKDLLAAKAAFEANQAMLNALLEQLKFTAWQKALLSSQDLQRAQQSEAVNRSKLFILGYHEEDLTEIDPITEGEQISHYTVKAPFAGTIIDKNVVLGERVGIDTRMFQLTDLSSLWVQADIYQGDLPLLKNLGSRSVRFRTGSDEETHQADVFYTGDVVDPQTRAARLMAVTSNPQRDLKPGMFVEVELPEAIIPDVLQLPATAIQRADGEAFVFVHTGGDRFERRDVQLGGSSDGQIEILVGLKPDEQVVVEGGFSLKSELLKELMSDSD